MKATITQPITCVSIILSTTSPILHSLVHKHAACLITRVKLWIKVDLHRGTVDIVKKIIKLLVFSIACNRSVIFWKT